MGISLERGKERGKWVRRPGLSWGKSNRGACGRATKRGGRGRSLTGGGQGVLVYLPDWT